MRRELVREERAGQRGLARAVATFRRHLWRFRKRATPLPGTASCERFLVRLLISANTSRFLRRRKRESARPGEQAHQRFSRQRLARTGTTYFWGLSCRADPSPRPTHTTSPHRPTTRSVP